MEDLELMPKSVAITELGGTVTEAARRMGTSVAAISKWPDPLSRRITERVYGVLALQRQRREAADGDVGLSQRPIAVQIAGST